MKKKVLFVLAIICLVTLIAPLLFSSCSSQPSSPAPSASPSAAPAAKSSPAATGASKPPTTIRLNGLTIGSSPYLMSHALGEIINKNSSWLKVDVLEGMSSSANLAILQEKPERRADTIVFSTSISNGDARVGRAPFKQPYAGARLLATFASNPFGLYTTNPAIKTVADMKGHTAHFGPRGSTPATLFAKLVEVEGIADQVKTSYGSWETMKDSIINGTSEIGPASAVGYVGIGFAPSPNFMEPYTARKLTFVNFTKEQADKTTKALSYNEVVYTQIPAGAVFKDQPGFPAFTWDTGWWADETLNADVAAEIARICTENINLFGNYHEIGKYMRPENIAWAPIPPDLVHPGALKYYRDHKIPVANEAKGS